MTLLVVDDEPSIRDIIKRYMEEHGHKVFISSDGYSAIDPNHVPHSRIEVILLDLSIPEINSYDLAERLTVLCPAARLIYMSADPDLFFKAEELIVPETVFLEKPFTLIDLESLINEVDS